jgi:hypothetical protein
VRIRFRLGGLTVVLKCRIGFPADWGLGVRLEREAWVRDDPAVPPRVEYTLLASTPWFTLYATTDDQ